MNAPAVEVKVLSLELDPWSADMAGYWVCFGTSGVREQRRLEGEGVGREDEVGGCEV